MGFRGNTTLTLNTGAEAKMMLPASEGWSPIPLGGGPGQPWPPQWSVRKSMGCSEAENWHTASHWLRLHPTENLQFAQYLLYPSKTTHPALESCGPLALSPPQRRKLKGDSCTKDHKEGECENKGWQRQRERRETAHLYYIVLVIMCGRTSS